MLFFSFSQSDFEFYAAARVVQVDRYQRVACAFHAADESFDFFGVHQQFACARGIGIDMCGSRGQRADMRADQMQRFALHNDVSLFQLRTARAYGFHFPAFEHHAGLEALFDEIVVEGFFVFDDTHALILPVPTVPEVSKTVIVPYMPEQMFMLVDEVELRAPLRTIDGFSERIQVEFADRLDAQSRHYLDRIRAGAANMNKLIDDLLGLSQVTRSDMAMGNVDVSVLVRQVFEELCQREPDHRAEIVIGENMTARGDAYLLRILFVNLIGNALKFSGKREVSRIEVGESTGRGKISTFFVRDNGAGFDPAYASKMFGVFQRLHSAKEFPGSGVGLATVQRIVHRHGGHVSAQGALDKGATIHFSLRRD